jgi:hypothetical protein
LIKSNLITHLRFWAERSSELALNPTSSWKIAKLTRLHKITFILTKMIGLKDNYNLGQSDTS